MNEHFIQSELEYRRQQRLAAAAEYRRAKSAAQGKAARSRLANVIDALVPGRNHDRRQPAAHAVAKHAA